MDLKRLMLRYAGFSKLATLLIKDKGKTLRRVQDGFKKATNNKGSLTDIWDELQLLFSLVKDYAKGDYTAISKSAIISILAGLLYFISPLDLVPDFILGLGFLDDVIVLRFVYKKMRKELEQYQAWKVARANIVNVVK